MVALEWSELTEKIIGAAIAVHKELGPGFLESVYERALLIEIPRLGLSVQSQIEVPITYRGVEVGLHRLDLLVESKIVVELKAIQDFEDIHFSIVRSYLKALNLRHGLLLNFGTSKLSVKRVIFDPT